MPFVCVCVCVCVYKLYFFTSSVCFHVFFSSVVRDELLQFSPSSTARRSVTVVLPPQVAEGHGVPLGPDALRAH